MKTNLLFGAALLLSTASFAQTNVQSASSVTASATVHTGAVKATAEKANKTKNDAKQKAKATAEKSEASTQATAKAANGEVRKDRTVSVSAAAEGSTQASAGNNKTTQDASLYGGSSVSTGSTVQKADEIKTEAKTTAKSDADQTVETTNGVKAHAKTTVQSVKPRPIAIRAQTRINAGGGIKIK